MPDAWEHARSELAATLKRRVVEQVRTLRQLGVVDGLSAVQRLRLGKLLVDLSAFNEGFDRTRSRAKLERLSDKRGPGQLRKVRRKFNKVKDALADLRSYVDRIGVGSGPAQSGNVFLARFLTARVTPYLARAVTALDESAWQEARKAKIEKGAINTDAILKALDQIYIPDTVGESENPSALTSGVDPKSYATTRLMAFFVTECGLTKSQASQRTARIGNAFFDWNVDESDHHESANPQRSRAILKRLSRQAKRRLKPDRDTPEPPH